MKVRLKDGLLIVTALTPDERDELGDWAGQADGHVFALLRQPDWQTLRLTDLGPRAHACREPINVTSRSPDPIVLISTFAHTPFELDGQRYAGVEGFWQSPKFSDPAKQRAAATLYGQQARAAGFDVPYVRVSLSGAVATAPRFYDQCLVPRFPDPGGLQSVDNIDECLRQKTIARNGANNYHVNIREFFKIVTRPTVRASAPKPSHQIDQDK
jgi:hypothetical protein